MPEARDLLDDGLRLEKAGELERALACYTAALECVADPAAEAEAWRRCAHVYRARCEWPEALNAARRSALLAQESGAEGLLAEALNAEAAVHHSRGDFEQAVTLYQQILKSTSDQRIRGIALQNMASVRGMQNDMTAAENFFRAAYECFRAADYAWGKAHVLNNLGRVAFERGRLGEAESLLQQAVTEAHAVEDSDLAALAQLNRAEVLLAQGDHEAAETVVQSALVHFTASGSQWRRIDSLRLLGDVYTQRQALPLAERFYRSALQIAEEIGARPEREQLLERLRG